MGEREFLIELCDRLIDARGRWLAAQQAVIRAEAERKCAEAEVRTLEAQLETARVRDSLAAA